MFEISGCSSSVYSETSGGSDALLIKGSVTIMHILNYIIILVVLLLLL